MRGSAQSFLKKLSQILQPLFPGSRHVFELSLGHLSDREIWHFAKENFSIITKDKDFYYLSGTLGHPPGIAGYHE